MTVAANQTQHFSRSWQDIFGSATVTLEGKHGGRDCLVLCQPQDAQAALEVLHNQNNFRGRIHLAVLEGLHAAPIEALLAQTQAKLVLVLGNANGIVTQGDGFATNGELHTTSTGLQHQEPLRYEAWNGGAWLRERWPSNARVSSGACSTVAARGLPCALLPLAQLQEALEQTLSVQHA